MNIETVLALKKAQEKFNQDMLEASNLYENQLANAEQAYRDRLVREVSEDVSGQSDSTE